MKYLLIIYLLVFYSFFAEGQKVNYQIDYFNTQSGLTDDHILAMGTDSKNLFIANRLHISVFDGTSFTELVDIREKPKVLSMVVAESRYLWILFENYYTEDLDDKLLLYDIKTGQVLPSNFTYSSKVQLHQKVFETLFLENDNPFLSLYQRQSVLRLKRNRDSIDIIASRKKMFYDTEDLRISKIYPPPPNSLRNYKVPSPSIRKQDRLQSVIKLPTGDDIFIVRHYSAGNERKSPHKYLCRNDGTVLVDSVMDFRGFDLLDDHLIVSGDNAVYSFSIKENKVQKDLLANISSDITEIYCSVKIDDKVWVGTNGGLVSIKAKDGAYSTYLTDSGISFRDIEIINSDSVLLASEAGLFLFLPKEEIVKVISDKAYYYGIVKLRDGEYLLGDGNNNRNHIYNSTKNTLTPKSFHPYTRILNGLEINTDSTILLSKSSPLLLTRQSLNSYEAKNIDCPHSRFSSAAHTSHGDILLFSATGNCRLSRDSLYLDTLYSDLRISFYQENTDGTIWIGTKGDGFIQIDKSTGAVDTINVKSGLLSNNVHFATKDSRNRIWLSTDYGLSVVEEDLSGLITLTTNDGLAENEMNRHSYALLPDSSIILGSIDGFFHFYPNSLDIDLGDQMLELESVSYYDMETNEYKTISQPNARELRFSNKFKDAKLQISSPFNASNYGLMYFYANQPKGEITYDQTVPIESLPDGSTELYIYQILGLNKLSEPLKITISNPAKLYLRPWFISLIFLLVSLSVYLWLIYSKARLSKMNRRIKKQVQAQTVQLSEKVVELSRLNTKKAKIFALIGHDLKSPLTSLTSLSTNLNYLINKGDTERLLQLGSVIEANSKSTLDIVERLMQWSSTVKNDSKLGLEQISLTAVVDRAAKDLDTIITEKQTRIIKDIPTDATVSSELESLTILVRNILHNAVKFSPKGSSVTIRYSVEDDSPVLYIKDQGPGILQNRKVTIDKIVASGHLVQQQHKDTGTQIGLILCKQLAQRINVDIHFLSLPNEGTEVDIRFIEQP